MKIGVLLPKSTTHPLIGHDFLSGLKLSMVSKGMKDLEILTGNIGFGVDEELIYSETERLFLEEGVDILIVFADHPKVAGVFPLLNALNKLLIVVNSGAKYPESWQSPGNVVYLTLNDILNCRLTGQLAVEDGYKIGAMTTSFYDGGYSLCHALTEGFLDVKGEIEYNFISKLKEKLNVSPLIGFLENQEDKIALLSVFSSDLVPDYLRQLKDSGIRNYGIFASPSFLHDSDLEKLVDQKEEGDNYFPELKGFVSWWPDLNLASNREFMLAFKASAKRKASAFAALGWDAGLICKLISTQEELDDFQATDLIAYLKEQEIESTRGALLFDESTHHYISPSYLVTSIEGELVVSGTSDSKRETWNEIVQTTEELPLTGWYNTYLCS